MLRSEAVVPVTMNITVFYYVTLCTEISEGSAASIVTVDEGCCERTVHDYQTTRHHEAEDGFLSLYLTLGHCRFLSISFPFKAGQSSQHSTPYTYKILVASWNETNN